MYCGEKNFAGLKVGRAHKLRDSNADDCPRNRESCTRQIAVEEVMGARREVKDTVPSTAVLILAVHKKNTLGRYDMNR